MELWTKALGIIPFIDTEQKGLVKLRPVQTKTSLFNLSLIGWKSLIVYRLYNFFSLSLTIWENKLSCLF